MKFSHSSSEITTNKPVSRSSYSIQQINKLNQFPVLLVLLVSNLRFKKKNFYTEFKLFQHISKDKTKKKKKKKKKPDRF